MAGLFLYRSIRDAVLTQVLEKLLDLIPDIAPQHQVLPKNLALDSYRITSPIFKKARIFKPEHRFSKH